MSLPPLARKDEAGGDGSALSPFGPVSQRSDALSSTPRRRMPPFVGFASAAFPVGPLGARQSRARRLRPACASIGGPAAAANMAQAAPTGSTLLWLGSAGACLATTAAAVWGPAATLLQVLRAH